MAQLNDQLWRRLGITQTFDRLLVEAAASAPGGVDEVRDHAGRQFTGGGAKFWQLSFPQLKRDLCRKLVLTEAEGRLSLHEEFAERMIRLLTDVASGASRVEPTPGVTLEEVLEKSARREAKDRAAKRSRQPRSTPRAKAPAANATPITRAGAAGLEEPAAAPAASAPAQTLTPANKVFTSLKVNKLLDHLDNTTLSKSQLGDRLELRAVDIDRFLATATELELTRVSRDGLVELHWKGREYARTTGADRRMRVIELVKDLRGRSGSS
jgi:hypothetical protein